MKYSHMIMFVEIDFETQKQKLLWLGLLFVSLIKYRKNHTNCSKAN